MTSVRGQTEGLLNISTDSVMGMGLERWINSLKFVYSLANLMAYDCHRSDNFPRVKWLSPPSEAHNNGKWKINQILAAKVTRPRTEEHLSLNDISVKTVT